MKSKLIAKDEFDTTRVMLQLSDNGKTNRLTSLYTDEEIKEVLGYYEGGNEDVKSLYFLEEDSPDFLNELYKIAIINGNFEQAIAMNIYLPI